MFFIRELSTFYSLFFVTIFCLVLFFNYTYVQASALYLESESEELNRGGVAVVHLKLDIDKNEGCVNAIDTVLKYDPGLELVDISTGSSLISLWVENPIIDNKSKTLSFAGGIPNGYCGGVSEVGDSVNTLLEMIFKISDKYNLSDEDNEIAKISFAKETTVYLNDGIGTALKPETGDLVLNLSGRLVTDKNLWQQKISEDTIPPAEFIITLQQNDNVFGGKNYIIFNTTDKQTGIDHYEVMEEPVSQFGSFSWGRIDAPWVVTRSPYILKDQTLNSIIRVKAVDKAGNEYIANLMPESKVGFVNGYRFILIIGLLFVFLFVVIIIKLLKKKGSDSHDVFRDDNYGSEQRERTGDGNYKHESYSSNHEE